ncbi:MAG: peroxide stress protein YaaA [Fidelibacterota bacterium]|jgi:cytoplasmic iron level regulating protein YaaA (DUF328/UPF0246 family)
MITLLSPAKKLSKDCFAQTKYYKKPQFLDKSKYLVESLKKLDPLEYMSLMNISESLAILNWERMQSWGIDFKPNNSREAIFSFSGDTYTGLDANSLSSEDVNYSDSNIRILSGLYGILKPLDLVMPYRLEMGTKLVNKHGKNLYEYWNNILTDSINDDLKSHETKTIINCASLEYFKSIKRKKLNAKVVTPQFKDWKNGELKIISFFAKKARGMMARFIIINRIENENDIHNFNLGGYNYESKLSTPLEPVFTRNSA